MPEVKIYIQMHSLVSLLKEFSDVVHRQADKKIGELDPKDPDYDAKITAVIIGMLIVEHKLWCIGNGIPQPDHKVTHKMHPTQDVIYGFWVTYTFRNQADADMFSDRWA